MVTGGAGYIGAHVLAALAGSGRRAIAYDNLSNGFQEATAGAEFVHGDIRDHAALAETMARFEVDAVIHLAGLIEVGRSRLRPDLFWEHNVAATATLLGAMRARGVERLVFSSSAAVYGDSPGQHWSHLLSEASPKAPASPYGDTKLAAERLIGGFCRAFGLRAVALRYFNAAGADAGGRLGEAHHPETHLIPLAIGAALGVHPPLTIFGDDFDTPDGTCLRDYVHVSDLAAAHVAALEAPLEAGEFEAINVGAGRGRSVLSVIAAVEQAVGRPVPRSVGARRPGDPTSLVADPSLAGARLSWTPLSSSLPDIVASAARWHADPRYGPWRSAAP
jgi:UDP-glucose 4-epimerase/UDP-arabinose 4-epimerase